MTSAYLIDLGERVAATYLASFFGLLISDATGATVVGGAKAAAIAAIPAALSALKGAVAKFIGSGDSASLVL